VGIRKAKKINHLIQLLCEVFWFIPQGFLQSKFWVKDDSTAGVVRVVATAVVATATVGHNWGVRSQDVAREDSIEKGQPWWSRAHRNLISIFMTSQNLAARLRLSLMTSGKAVSPAQYKPRYSAASIRQKTTQDTSRPQITESAQAWTNRGKLPITHEHLAIQHFSNYII